MTMIEARCRATVDEQGRRIRMGQIAKDAGISQSDMSDLVTGKRPFTRGNLQKLCRYFQCEPRDLAGWIRFKIPD